MRKMFTLPALGFAGLSHATVGSDAAAAVTAASTDAELVYAAVIAALAAFFVVKLIRRAL